MKLFYDMTIITMIEVPNQKALRVGTCFATSEYLIYFELHESSRILRSIHTVTIHIFCYLICFVPSIKTFHIIVDWIQHLKHTNP